MGQAFAELARRDVRVLRPQDAAGVYAYPRPELARLVGRGMLRRLARGYYVVVPQASVGDPHWRPAVEAAGWGIAAADYGREHVALMGLSAARLHGAIPRALSLAVVAIPKQRPLVHLADGGGQVLFVKRAVERLDVERMRTELGEGLVTSVEQTVIDLMARPGLGGMTADAQEAAAALLPRADRQILEDLAEVQRRRAGLERLTRSLDA